MPLPKVLVRKQEVGIMKGTLTKDGKTIEGEFEVAVYFYPEEPILQKRLGYVIGHASRIK